jgi:hypothetical protein
MHPSLAFTIPGIPNPAFAEQAFPMRSFLIMSLLDMFSAAEQACPNKGSMDYLSSIHNNVLG